MFLIYKLYVAGDKGSDQPREATMWKSYRKYNKRNYYVNCPLFHREFLFVFCFPLVSTLLMHGKKKKEKKQLNV